MSLFHIPYFFIYFFCTKYFIVVSLLAFGAIYLKFCTFCPYRLYFQCKNVTSCNMNCCMSAKFAISETNALWVFHPNTKITSLVKNSVNNQSLTNGITAIEILMNGSRKYP